MRDSILKRVPVVLVSELYGTIAIIIGIVINILDYYNSVSEVSLLIVFSSGLALRLVSYYRKWHLPRLGSE